MAVGGSGRASRRSAALAPPSSVKPASTVSVWVDAQPGLGQGGLVTAPSQDAGAHRRLARKVADSSMAELDQVPGGEPGAGHVVGADERVHPLLAVAVHEDIRGALVAERAHGRVLQEAAGQDDAVDPARRQGLQVGTLAVWAAVGVAEQDLVAARRGRVLDAAEKRAEERVGDVGDDHREDQGLAELQAAGDAVGSVLGLAEQGLDAGAGGGCDAQARVVVDHPRHRRRVDFRHRRQLFEGHRHAANLPIDIRIDHA